MQKLQTHDRLLAECFQHLWNTYPETRYTMFHVTNETRPINPEAVRILIIQFCKFIGTYVAQDRIAVFLNLVSYDKEHIRRMSQAKAIGVVAGVTDLIWYWKGKCIVLDAKVGTDRLSDAQKSFIAAIEKQGGAGHTFGTFEEFCAIVKKYI